MDLAGLDLLPGVYEDTGECPGTFVRQPFNRDFFIGWLHEFEQLPGSPHIPLRQLFIKPVHHKGPRRRTGHIPFPHPGIYISRLQAKAVMCFLLLRHVFL